MITAEANQPRTYLGQIPALRGISDIIRFIPMLFVYALVPYVYFVGAYQLWHKRKVLPARLLQSLVLIHLVGLALFLSVAHGPRYFRLCTVAPPAILIGVWLISLLGRAQKLTRRVLWCLAFAFALLFTISRQTRWHGTLDLPIGQTAFTDIDTYHEFQWLAQRTRPSEYFFNNSALCVYLSLYNPTASEFMADDETSRPEQVASVVDSLRHHQPHFIVLSAEDKNTPSIHNHSVPFRQYVHNNYHLAHVFYLDDHRYEQELWERKP